MAPFDPKSARNINHGGTFCGSPITMAAGLATMRDYGKNEVSRINALGTRMANGITSAFKTAGIAGQACGDGSICQIHWALDHIVNSRESITAASKAGQLPRLLHLELMNRGVFSATCGMFVVSTRMGDAEIDALIAAVGGALDTLKPYIAEAAPRLLLR
jgi:glutamate-1-semialdehyde 2,1-aminomutase